ncbi:MAG TPA: PIN domain-containing protein [Acidimicrobiales bacterium]|nr:PIN domain-containing protein [Acidimicrobiales bacterium]
MYAADTSVAVPFVHAAHGAHPQARTAVTRARPALAGHAAFETFSVLTRLPLPDRLSPAEARRAIDENFGEPSWLTVHGTARVWALLREGRLAGGAVYDALVAQAAFDHERTLLTLDRRAARTYEVVGVEFELLS